MGVAPFDKASQLLDYGDIQRICINSVGRAFASITNVFLTLRLRDRRGVRIGTNRMGDQGGLRRRGNAKPDHLVCRAGQDGWLGPRDAAPNWSIWAEGCRRGRAADIGE